MVGVDDLYVWHEAPVDLDGDADADGADREYLEAAIRWGEAVDMLGGRR